MAARIAALGRVTVSLLTSISLPVLSFLTVPSHFASARCEAIHGLLHAVAAEGDALHQHRGLDARQAAENHRGIDVAEVSDSEGAPGLRAEAAGERDLETLARDAAQRFDIDAGTHVDGGDRDRTRLGHAAVQGYRPCLRPAFDRCLHRAREQGVARMHRRHALALEEREGGLEPKQKVLRRGAAELPVTVIGLAPSPVPVIARRGIARRNLACACVDCDQAQAWWTHQPFLRSAYCDVDAERIHRERSGRK